MYLSKKYNIRPPFTYICIYLYNTDRNLIISKKGKKDLEVLN